MGRFRILFFTLIFFLLLGLLGNWPRARRHPLVKRFHFFIDFLFWALMIYLVLFLFWFFFVSRK